MTYAFNLARSFPRERMPKAKNARPRLNGPTVPGPGPERDAADFTVVAIGASAGGLEACTKLVAALPAGSGMAFILVQHLDPAHESMMVELLAGHTSIAVLQAANGMPLQREHLYVIPPATYLSVRAGALALSRPEASRGARLPFDFLLHSLAEEYGGRTACVILSGTGSDGSVGLVAVKKAGGFVIAQDPKEAGYDGMPRSAIQTGAVDLVLPAAAISDALVGHDRRIGPPGAQVSSIPRDPAAECLPAIIDLLRTKTVHDFSLYRRGTLQRRIERRMAMAAIETNDMDRYLEILRRDDRELVLLARSLLINVTGFFRDPKVFERLAEKIIPELVGDRTSERPIRVWIAGCSTGEETYSLAMLFCEEIAAAKSPAKLQVFASDIDADAVAVAREGLYPDTIEADVSAARLARFFKRDDHGYRVSPELRALVVFAVQDVLADPPFSRLDLVSCRNLLIYLGPEAQAKVMSQFHFALREGGILLLGSAETAGQSDGRFDVISMAERLYRHVDRSRPGTLGVLRNAGEPVRVRAPLGRAPVVSRHAALADLVRRLVLECYAPAAILIDRTHQCLFSIGPTDRFLRMSAGQPTHDLLAMARPGLRTRLKSATQSALHDKKRIVVNGGRMVHEGHPMSFNIDVQPVQSDGEALLLVCFVDAPAQDRGPARAGKGRTDSRVTDLEHELDDTRTELRAAIRDLELSSEKQNAINEEALSVHEEYQSTNEELLTSKEELQSVNEELTALNSQLQETLERQRTTSDDLQNVLYSTDVATLFLDVGLKIRFFTPATRSLFAVIAGDVGRPLADLQSLAPDSALPADARAVLQGEAAIEREIEAPGGVWFRRRVQPYRTHDGGVEGVVITFADITRRKQIATALEEAKQEAELANVAKSRFLAAASHDLRQPLQTLALLHGLLARTVHGERAQRLVGRLDETLGAMSGMLNTLLDINQIEAGVVRADIADFPINDLLGRLREEFTYHAQSQGLALRVIPCGLTIRSDPRLLEQMLRNLLSNALKYTRRGKILLGCRRWDGTLSVEVWDTGVGIPEDELKAIFEEYHQLDNAARERSRGLGLGLSIVRRLGDLLGHRVRVRSRRGQGSVFSVEVACPSRGAAPPIENSAPSVGDGAGGDGVTGRARHAGAILIVEDDPEVRELLELFLTGEGHRTAVATDGPAALEVLTRDMSRPNLILADYNLPNGLNGLQLAARVRERLGREIPVIILTGDISSDTLRDVSQQNCVQFTKPVKLTELAQAIQRLLATPDSAARPAAPHANAAALADGPASVFIVDDDAQVREALRSVIEDDGRTAAVYGSSEEFLDAYRPTTGACLLIDAYLPGMGGIALLQRLHGAGHHLPAIMITGSSDVPMAVAAMKAGASDFIEKPVHRDELLASIDRALEQSRDADKRVAWKAAATGHLADLTPRQREIMTMILAGHPSKNIAADLGISQRTVESHRASIMKRTGAASLPALARLALIAAWGDADEPPVPGASNITAGALSNR